MSSNSAAPGDNELAVSDLGPLAWVLDELRKSLDGATMLSLPEAQTSLNWMRVICG
jgi:hypothetical protein